MKRKKLMVGVIAMTLVLGTGTAVYAAEPHIFNLLAAQTKGEISTVREGIQSFDETDLPEGVQFAQEISEGDAEGGNRTQSISIDDAEGVLTFDETDLPEGVQFAEKVSGDIEGGNRVQYTDEAPKRIANGAMNLE